MYRIRVNELIKNINHIKTINNQNDYCIMSFVQKIFQGPDKKQIPGFYQLYKKLKYENNCRYNYFICLLFLKECQKNHMNPFLWTKIHLHM